MSTITTTTRICDGCDDVIHEGTSWTVWGSRRDGPPHAKSLILGTFDLCDGCDQGVRNEILRRPTGVLPK